MDALKSLRSQMAKGSKKTASGSQSPAQEAGGSDHSSTESGPPNPKRQRVERQGADADARGKSPLSRGARDVTPAGDGDQVRPLPNRSSPSYGSVLSENFPFEEFMEKIYTPEVMAQIAGADLAGRLRGWERKIFQLGAYLRHCEGLAGELDTCRKERDAAKEDLAQEKEHLANVIESMAEYKREADTAQAERARAEKAEADLAVLKLRFADLQKEKGDLETSSAELRKNNSSLSVQVSDLRAQAEVDLEHRKVLADNVFVAVMSQVKLLCPDVDFTEVGIFNEVRDGKIVPMEDEAGDDGGDDDGGEAAD